MSQNQDDQHKHNPIRVATKVVSRQLEIIIKKLYGNTHNFIIDIKSDDTITITNKITTTSKIIKVTKENLNSIQKPDKTWIDDLTNIVVDLQLLKHGLSDVSNKGLTNKWIVVFKSHVNCKCSLPKNIKVDHTYGSVINGICCHACYHDLDKLVTEGLVENFVVDQAVQIQQNAPKKIITKDYLAKLYVQNSNTNSTIGQLSSQYISPYIYRVGANNSSQASGNGTNPNPSLENRTDINVFVVDTGIAFHTDLNVVGGRNFSGGDVNAWQDGNGHGTHVAGIIGARDNHFGMVGIAPGVRLWSVRVLNNSGSGTISGVINGLNWILANRNVLWKGNAIVNLSLGGGASSLLDAAVNTLINNGIPVVVAAGNSGQNAYFYSPARVSNAITVGATSPLPSYYLLASFSNYGTIVDILAPGTQIYSTYLRNMYASISGTSMATPIVTGTVALMLSTVNVPGQGLTFCHNIRNILVSVSAAYYLYNYNRTYSYNNRVYIPPGKYTTNINVWAGRY